MNLLLVSPVLVPLVTAVACLLLWSDVRLQRIVSVAGAFTLFAVSWMLLGAVRSLGIQITELGNWPAPFGIVLVADLFSAIMVFISALVAALISVYSLASIDLAREKYGYHAFFQFLLMGVCGAFLTGDLFNLFVWFEVMLLSSFVLLSLGGEKAQLEGAIKYVTINLFSSAVFLAAAGLLYGMVGTLNMAHASLKLGALAESNPGMVTALAMLFLVAFGVKAAIFPLFFWLPASYHTPPVVVTALFAGLLTKVGVYSLIRVFTLIFTHNLEYTHNLILVISGFTMVVGVLGALAQMEVRRLLSFHIVSQIGYMTMGLALFTPLALAGSIFHMLHNIIAKTNLFLISGVTNRLGGSYDLKKLGGFYRAAPFLSILFLVSALGLAGTPPLSGFFSKVVLIYAALEVRSYWIVAASLVVSVFTLMSMTKIWAEAYWKPNPDGSSRPTPPLSMAEKLALLAPISVMALLVVAMGIFAGPLIELLIQASEQLLDPVAYIQVVLGEVR